MFLVKVELFLKECVVFVDSTSRFVQVEVVVCSVDNAARNVGAVVGYTLEVGEKVRPHKACFDRAVALAETNAVTGTKLLFEVIDNLFERLYLCGNGKVAGHPDASGDRLCFA